MISIGAIFGRIEALKLTRDSLESAIRDPKDLIAACISPPRHRVATGEERTMTTMLAGLKFVSICSYPKCFY
jgi:hypothetical protein